MGHRTNTHHAEWPRSEIVSLSARLGQRGTHPATMRPCHQQHAHVPMPEWLVAWVRRDSATGAHNSSRHPTSGVASLACPRMRPTAAIAACARACYCQSRACASAVHLMHWPYCDGVTRAPTQRSGRLQQAEAARRLAIHTTARELTPIACGHCRSLRAVAAAASAPSCSAALVWLRYRL